MKAKILHPRGEIFNGHLELFKICLFSLLLKMTETTGIFGVSACRPPHKGGLSPCAGRKVCRRFAEVGHANEILSCFFTRFSDITAFQGAHAICSALSLWLLC